MFLRLKFEKTGPIRFIGHLDLMRTFQKLFMRSGLPIAYSEGFNPHQIFSFATALAVGVSSEAEYMDVRFKEAVSLQFVIDRMNQCAPTGIRIIEGVVLQAKEPKAMAALAAAKYRIAQNSEMITQAMIDDLLSSEEVVIQKKTKKGKIKDLDLRPGIYNLVLKDGSILMTIATGSSFNIKPEQVLTYMLEKDGQTYTVGSFKFHREELYLDNQGLKPLLETKQG